MPSEDDTRSQGIEFGDLPESLESIEYPADVETIVEAFGDRRLEFESGSMRLDEVLATVEEETFESPEGVLETVKTVIGDEAVGREGYSDRGAGGTEQDESDDQSF